MTVSVVDAPASLPLRSSLAVTAVTATNRLSRALGRGSGTVVGGRAGLVVDPALLARLARGRAVALVSGTNGKTTTTRLLATALGTSRSVATNLTGANMPAGHVAALAEDRSAPLAVLEVDESYLGRLVEETSPRVVVLLNLSRDQLDRVAEVRMVADRWRRALAGVGGGAPGSSPVVVANTDDPMVVWAARSAPGVRWVGAGQVWHDDAVGCPACGGRIAFGVVGGWACDRCEFARPAPCAWLEGGEVVLEDGTRLPIALRLPGQFNRANAAMVVVASLAMAETGAPVPELDARMIVERLASVEEVAGRFSTTTRRGSPVRLLLAKNPAGWTAVFDLLDEAGVHDAPVVLSVNARVADGLDTSWLWDVPFERLAGRTTVATGDRRLDLAVRLHYAEVDHTVVEDPLGAVDAAIAAAADGRTVEFLGNYTAFADLRSLL